MKRIRLYQWLGFSLLGIATGCGSTRSDRFAEGPTSPRGVALVYSDSATARQSCRTYRPPQAAPAYAAPAYVTQASHQVSAVPIGGEVVTADHTVIEGANQEAEVIQVSAEPPLAPLAANRSSAPAPAPAGNSGQWAPVVEHVVAPRFSNLHGESIPARRVFHDITASPCFAKAEDYSWLQGQVEYTRLSKSWRLRYASVDEEDRFGGSVTLTGDTVLDSLKDGEYVRIRGYLPNPDARGSAPTYRVEAIEAVESSQ